MSRPNALGEYLRARRELIDPADAGLRVVGVRRTPGLRREEVATLAGISADYYLRLEQGRDRNPSPQVLEALARVLRLDATGTQHLLSLCSARPGASRRPRREAVPTGIRQLLEVINLPAFVESQMFDVLWTTRGSSSWSASCRSPASRSGGCGPGTTSPRLSEARCGCATRRWACSSCAGRNCR
jgi:transcriptional regulator with XRE-family HTH domain